jgi:hypothetical protein
MKTTLTRRIEVLEQHRERTASDPKELTDDELLDVIECSLGDIFETGKLQDVEEKLRAYQAQGKTIKDLADEEQEWFMGVLQKMADGEVFE